MSSRRTRSSTRAGATLDQHFNQTRRHAAGPAAAAVGQTKRRNPEQGGRAATKRQRTALTEHNPNVPVAGKGKKKKGKKGTVAAQPAGRGVRTRAQKAATQENASVGFRVYAEAEDFVDLSNDDEEEEDSEKKEAGDDEESDASSIASAPLERVEPEVVAEEVAVEAEEVAAEAEEVAAEAEEVAAEAEEVAVEAAEGAAESKANDNVVEVAAVEGAEANPPMVYAPTQLAVYRDGPMTSAAAERFVEVTCTPVTYPEGVTDIFVRHRPSHRYCSDYSDDVYFHLRAQETKTTMRGCYIGDVQADVTADMRAIMVDWLVEVAQEYRLAPLTLHYCIGFVDRALCHIPTPRSKLQLLGCACMQIAAKMQEVSNISVDEFVYISDNTYTREEILEMEKIVLSKLDYKLLIATPWHYMKRFLLCGPAESVEILLAHYVAELSLQHYEALKFPSSMVAAASVLLSRLTLMDTDKPPRTREPWTKNHAFWSGYDVEDLVDCVMCLHNIHLDAQTNNLIAIKQKYSHGSFHYVARRPPLPVTTDIGELIYRLTHEGDE